MLTVGFAGGELVELSRNTVSSEGVRPLRRLEGRAGLYHRVVDAQGRSAAFSGERALGRNGHHLATDAVAAGNMLRDAAIPAAMTAAFVERPGDHLGERLLAALDAALALGGEEGSIHSAGMLIVDAEDWPLVDLRVDWSDSPIAALHDLWTLWAPQMNDYVARGIDPTRAPSYGVPGDP